MAFTASTIKRWLFIGLLLSNLALGGMSFFLLHELDASYSQLVRQSVPVLTQLHEITMSVMHTQRALALSLMADGKDSFAALEQAERFQANADARRLIYQRSPDLINGTGVDQEIEAVAKDYRARAGEFIALMHAGRREEAASFRLSVLRQSSDRYYDVIERRVAELERRADQASRDNTDSTGTRAGIVLTLASWPVLAGLLIALVMGLTLLALVVAVFAPRIGPGRRS